MAIRNRLLCAVIAAWVLCAPALSWAGEMDYAQSYIYDRNGQQVDLGAQPLGFPSGNFSSAMARDRILQAQLAEQGLSLKVRNFLKGPDLIQHLDGSRLEAGLLGDMPTLTAAANGDMVIVALVKQTYSSVVGRDAASMSDLKGRRIAVAVGTSAHHALMRGLNSVGLDEKDISEIPMGVDDMPQFLAQGRIDAFAAWEPAPTIALNAGMGARVVFRGISTDFFVLSRPFVQTRPKAAQALVASFLRAFNWMASNRENLMRSVQWSLADSAAFSGKPARLTADQVASIIRREILDVPSAPAIPLMGGDGRALLQSEFDFLTGLGRLPAHVGWDKIARSFDRDMVNLMMADPVHHRIDQFDYAEDGL